MNWPDIFFRAKPSRRPANEPTPPPIEPDETNQQALVEPEAPLPDAPLPETFHPLPISKVVLPPAPVHPVSADSDVVRDMAEADTLRQLSRSGGVRLIKRDFFLPSDSPDGSVTTPGGAAAQAETSEPANPTPSPTPPSTESPSAATAAPETKRIAFPAPRTSPAINLSGSRESAPGGVYPSAMTIFRRRTKIADVARIVLPPRREEAPPSPARPAGVPTPAVPPPTAVPASAESTAIVLPAAFPVAMPTRTAPQVQESPAAAEPESIESISSLSESSHSLEVDGEAIVTDVPTDTVQPESESQNPVQELPGFAASDLPSEAPTTDPAKVESTTGPDPLPPASRNAADSSSLPATLPQADTREKREFVLANGERILGHILSETPEAIYVDHSTLGVLTIPRAQIAQRPVEIILINGDRVVGDIIAETADSLFVRHSSLGILTVPRNQRSTRVVEAILKDGDRILGEVLGETENFTVIRSATLGTVAVPHNRVAMLNRRAEQVEMKALPGPVPSLETKTS